MPQRPRSHQLEDISILRLKAAVPPSWVVRERSRDYGIDLEIEIFTEAGLSTGIIFYAQLRATDDPDKAKETRFKVDQLDYFDLLDIPTAIIRYSSSDDALFLKWGFEVDAAGSDAKSQKVTFKEADRWVADTPSRILKTLEDLRSIRAQETFAPIGFHFTNQASDVDISYRIDVAFEQMSRIAAAVRSNVGSGAGTTAIEVRANDSKVVIGLDRIAEFEVAIGNLSGPELLSHLSYTAVRLLWRLGLKAQAQRLAHWVFSENIFAPSPGMAMPAVMALLPNFDAALHVAFSAGIHRKQDENFLLLTAALQVACRPADHAAACVKLNVQAIRSGDYDGDPVSKAALHYSTANAYRSIGQFAAAIEHYTRAHRLRPDYAKSSYFLAEMAGCLYLRRKYRMAAKLYEAAYKIDPKSGLALLVGDAQMFTGEVTRAAELFDAAEDDASVGTPGEAALKGELCRRLATAHGASFARPVSKLPPLWDAAESSGDRAAKWREILDVDPLDPLANFNVGVALAAASQQDQAFSNFLAVALSQPGDTEAWLNTMVCAWPGDPLVFSVVLHLALFHCGREPYDLLRTRLSEVGAKDVLRDFDVVVRDILATNAASQSKTLAVRLFDGKDFRHVFNVPAL